MKIGIFEGYTMPRGHKRRKGRKMKTSMRKAMKACAKKHRVATKGFWTCVRGKKRR